ncbi:hypothetical protein ACFSCX_06635 [Bacillus salitolerans]|uniref:Uncharacterized protein n=1 Tax=Bacillus salitolerans TaxID=1437434 RepID=A0ABW4LQ58_9BACI
MNKVLVKMMDGNTQRKMDKTMAGIAIFGVFNAIAITVLNYFI